METDKHRLKMNAKFGHRLVEGRHPSFGETSFSPNEEKTYVKERFIPPEMSIMNYFVKKVSLF